MHVKKLALQLHTTSELMTLGILLGWIFSALQGQSPLILMQCIIPFRPASLYIPHGILRPAHFRNIKPVQKRFYIKPCSQQHMGISLVQISVLSLRRLFCIFRSIVFFPGLRCSSYNAGMPLPLGGGFAVPMLKSRYKALNQQEFISPSSFCASIQTVPVSLWLLDDYRYNLRF